MDAPLSLPDRLRHETRALHARAERSGVMTELLARHLGRERYVALLRNLHAIYEPLEGAFDALGAASPLRALWSQALRRAPRLADDLAVLHGAGWREAIAVAPAAAAYRARLDALAARGSIELAAHAYVRYLGDLNGGALLARRLRGRYAAGDAGLAFYDFGGDASSARLRDTLRAAIAALPLGAGDADALVAEARWAFEAHCRLFVELAAPA